MSGGAVRQEERGITAASGGDTSWVVQAGAAHGHAAEPHDACTARRQLGRQTAGESFRAAS